MERIKGEVGFRYQHRKRFANTDTKCQHINLPKIPLIDRYEKNIKNDNESIMLKKADNQTDRETNKQTLYLEARSCLQDCT